MHGLAVALKERVSGPTWLHKVKIEDTDVPIGINGWLLHLSQTYCVKLMGLYESSSGLTGWREKDILA
jgi:hypothetical protein